MRARLPGYAAALLAPLLIYLICRNAALALPGQAAIIAGATLIPAEYSATTRLLLKASQDPKFKLSPEMTEQARLALLAAPLAFEPFFIAAKAEEQAGRSDRALLLMLEAKRRRPNHAGTRAQLLVYQGRKANYDAFLTEIDFLLRRSEAAQMHLLPEMVKLIADPAGRRALAPLLAAEPNWREPLLRLAGDRGVKPEHAAAMIELIRTRKPRGDMSLETNFYVRSLIGAKNYRQAKATWLSALPAQQRSDTAVYDGEFKGSRAPAPFNWTLHDMDAGRGTIADARNSAPGLEIEYFGGRNAILAEQTLALSPGGHKLSLSARSEAAGQSGLLYWRISCLPDNRELTKLELSPLTEADRRFSVNFVVPAGCPGQSLALVAEAGDVASTVLARVSQMSIR